MAMRDRLVVLFGGGGFIGRYAAQAIMRTGARVRFAERDPRRAFFLKSLGALGQSQFVAADLTRPDTVARAVEGADSVVNLVGTFGKAMAQVHVDGARAVAEAAARAGAEALVHISAIGADASGQSRYAQTKGAGEDTVRQAFPAATILRPSVVFGQEDQFLNRFAQLIARAPDFSRCSRATWETVSRGSLPMAPRMRAARMNSADPTSSRWAN